MSKTTTLPSTPSRRKAMSMGPTTLSSTPTNGWVL